MIIHRYQSRESHNICKHENSLVIPLKSWTLTDHDAQVILITFNWLFQVISISYDQILMFNKIPIEYNDKVRLCHVRIALMYASLSTFNTTNYNAILRLYQQYNLKFTIYIEFHSNSHTKTSTTLDFEHSIFTDFVISSNRIEIHCISLHLTMFHDINYHIDSNQETCWLESTLQFALSSTCEYKNWMLHWLIYCLISL